MREINKKNFPNFKADVEKHRDVNLFITDLQKANIKLDEKKSILKNLSKMDLESFDAVAIRLKFSDSGLTGSEITSDWLKLTKSHCKTNKNKQKPTRLNYLTNKVLHSEILFLFVSKKSTINISNVFIRELMAEALIQKLSKLDPNNNNAFVPWLLKEYGNKAFPLEFGHEHNNRWVYVTLEAFVKNKEVFTYSDVYRYNLKTLYEEYVSTVPEQQLINKDKYLKRGLKDWFRTALDNEQIKYIFNDTQTNNLVIEIKSISVAQRFFKGAFWCVKKEQILIDYLEQGSLYVIYFNSKKILLHLNLMGFIEEKYLPLLELADHTNTSLMYGISLKKTFGYTKLYKFNLLLLDVVFNFAKAHNVRMQFEDKIPISLDRYSAVIELPDKLLVIRIPKKNGYQRKVTLYVIALLTKILDTYFLSDK